MKVIPVRVALRCRPLVTKEIDEGCQKCLQFVPGEQQVILGSDKAFTYDYVFDDATQQQSVYEAAVAKLVNGIFKGYNATVLAYGQTGSGKTFTMGGGYGVCVDMEEEIMGIIPRVIGDLFDGIRQRSEEYEFDVRVSYLEIYKEDLLDLLVPPAKRDKDALSIREEANTGIRIAGLSEEKVICAEDTMACLERGSEGRTVGATAMNNSSSRSHAIFTLHLERRSKTDSNDLCKAKFHLVDLAGSERQKKTKAEGERLREGININKGLLCLGNVISALGDENQRKLHIPYRDSKLTRLLQDSLGGNSHTVMIACVSPADSNLEETLSTLRYADRARKIKNKPTVNRDPQAAEILRLRALVQELQMQVINTGKAPVSNKGNKERLNSSTDRPASVNSSIDSTAAKTKLKELEDENVKLSNDLQKVINRNMEMCEKMVELESDRDQLLEKLKEVRELAAKAEMIDVSVQGDAASKSVYDEHKSVIDELKAALDRTQVEDKMTGMSIIETQNTSASTSPSNRAVPCEESKKYMMRQQQLHDDLMQLNKMLASKEKLAQQMENSDGHMAKMADNSQVKELESELEKIQKEKELLEEQLEQAKASKANTNAKVSEQRRIRLKELEAQLTQLRKKMTEQNKLLKMKEQSDKQVGKLNRDILDMKQQKVRLMKQMKEETDAFRKFKQEKEKELTQLKAKDRKRQVEMVKLERKYVLQQQVSKRKTEEAGAAQRRLKEALMKQKQTMDDRMKKQEQFDSTNAGSRIRKWIEQQLEMRVSIEAARHHLEELRGERKRITVELKDAKQKLDLPSYKKKMLNNSESIDEEKEKLREQVKDLEKDLDIVNAQITGMQEKLVDSDQHDKVKSWGIMSSIADGKSAVSYLLKQATEARVDKTKIQSQFEDYKTESEQATNAAEQAEKELKKVKLTFDEEMMDTRKEYENKILYLMDRLNKKNTMEVVDEDLKRQLEFQARELEKFTALQEDLEELKKINGMLKKDCTVTAYKKKIGLASGESSFFSPAMTSKSVSVLKEKKKKTKKPIVYVEDEEEEEELLDSSSDEGDEEDEWKPGSTPFAFLRHGKKKGWRGGSRTSSQSSIPTMPTPEAIDSTSPTLPPPVTLAPPVRRIPKRKSSPFQVCNCKGKCGNRMCSCVKIGGKCTEQCGCGDKCVNRLAPEPESTTTDDVTKEEPPSALFNTTFCVDTTADQSKVLTNVDTNVSTTSQGKRKSKEMKNKSSEGEDSTLGSTMLSQGGPKKRKLGMASQSYFPSLE